MMSPFNIGAFCALALLFGSSPATVHAQQTGDEVKKLKDQLDLLQQKYDLLQRENELLKKEIDLIKKAGAGSAGSPGITPADGPKTTVGDIDYVVQKATRNGNTVTLWVTATNHKADRVVTFVTIEGFDSDGKSYKTQLKENPRSLVPRSAKLLEDVKTKLQFSIEGVPSNVTELVRVEIRTGLSGGKIGSVSEPIKLRNVKIDK